LKNSSQKSNNSVVTIGKILKPRGLSGEVKVQVLTNKPESFNHVKNIDKISFSGGFAFIKFSGVTTLQGAEKLRGQLIQISRNLVPLDDDEVFADDLIGFTVLDQHGKTLGTVKKIESVGASEVFDCGNFMFPNEDAFVIETNMTKRQIIIRAEMLDEEVVL
jgi:16S rRNA processing protein RimM